MNFSIDNHFSPLHKTKRFTFINRLINILNDAAFSHIISWSKDGLSFIIHDKVEFQGLVLPKYFDSSKIESFSRQLNLYGFQRSSDGRKQRNGLSKSTSFTHPYFIRDKPYLIKYIKRKNNSKGLEIEGSVQSPKPFRTESSSTGKHNNIRQNTHDNELSTATACLNSNVVYSNVINRSPTFYIDNYNMHSSQNYQNQSFINQCYSNQNYLNQNYLKQTYSPQEYSSFKFNCEPTYLQQNPYVLPSQSYYLPLQ